MAIQLYINIFGLQIAISCEKPLNLDCTSFHGNLETLRMLLPLHLAYVIANPKDYSGQLGGDGIGDKAATTNTNTENTSTTTSTTTTATTTTATTTTTGSNIHAFGLLNFYKITTVNFKVPKSLYLIGLGKRPSYMLFYRLHFKV